MAHSFQVGDILSSSWGATMTLVDFYRVVKTTKTTITFVTMRSEETSDGGFLTGTSLPRIGTEDYGNPFKRKVQYSDLNKCDIVRGHTSSNIARKWDGFPLHYNHCD